jgi:haloalkane dehalogenase
MAAKEYPVTPEWVDRELFPFESKWLALDGHTIHYVDEGPRDGQVLLFAHPAPGWIFSYREQINELRKNFRCVAPDFPGYGLSKASEGYQYTLKEQSRFLERFVDVLNLREMIVWANDGGGPTAILALSHHPELVKGLVVGGTFGWSLAEYPKVTRMLKLFSSGFFRAINRYANFIPRSVEMFGLGTRKLSPKERLHYMMPFKDRNSRNRPLKLFRTFIDASMEEELNRALPAFRNEAALIQFGEEDAVRSQGWPERWAKEIPNSEIHILPKVKHFTFEDAPEAAIENFLHWWNTVFARPKLARLS